VDSFGGKLVKLYPAHVQTTLYRRRRTLVALASATLL